MESLPTSIEAYLDEAGFSGTEIIIMKKLLEEDALTLRELAAKTGKSTGVLDQAVKKLLVKKIVTKEHINESPKYMITSLNAILEWMEEDMEQKKETMERRHENFESFVRSITITKRRPEMEYFEGLEGMKQAYTKLLERGNDWLQYGPTLWLAEEDPLRDFRVQHFRERRKMGMFSRVITHDTMLGRRFQSRDPFEFRKSVLVDPKSYPLSFEKVIVGDTVACFQLSDQRACFIKYPELAQEERMYFERLWKKKVENERAAAAEKGEDADEVDPVTTVQPIKVPFKTKTLSQMREFFVSRRSLAVFALLGLLAGALTYGLYRYNVSINTKRIQDRVLSIAATGALQFDSADLAELHTLEDIKKPQYAKVVYQLNQIRNQNEGIAYAYLMRYKQGVIWEFIADADSIDPSKIDDNNHDGIINEADEYNYPGEQYDTYGDDNFKALYGPITIGPATDQWGTFITGWAPIKNERGETVAILGVDRFAGDVYTLSQHSFTPIYFFIGFFLLFVLLRLAAFNRSLLRDVIQIIKIPKFIAFTFAGLILVVIASVSIYYYNVSINKERVREKVVSIAATGSLQFSADELNQLRTKSDIANPVYEKVVNILKQIRKQNDRIKYAYLIRPRKNADLFEFIADADAYGIEADDISDGNSDGVVDEQDMIYPGQPYEIQHIDILVNSAYFSPTATSKPYTDQWGTVYTGYAPIKDINGNLAGLLAIDMDADQVYGLHFNVFIPLFIFVFAILFLILFKAPNFQSSLFYELMRHLYIKKIVYVTILVLMILYWLSFALYFYTRNILKEEIGKRLVSVAISGAAQINPKDLENLRFAHDMKREEYQRIYKQLNDIRNNNKDLTYVYIMRPTETEGIWEFVVDADSNYYLPDYYDSNNDSILNELDENVHPGVRYDITMSPGYITSYTKPIYEDFIQDQWGMYMNGNAPIKNDKGEMVAVFSVSYDIKNLNEEIWRRLLNINL